MDVGLVCDACSALTPIGVPQCARCGEPVALDPRSKRASKPAPDVPAAEPGATTCGEVRHERAAELQVLPQLRTRQPPARRRSRASTRASGRASPTRRPSPAAARCSSAPMQAARAKLTLIRGDGQDGVSFTLAGDEHLAGRGDCPLPFPEDPFLSPVHANFLYHERPALRPRRGLDQRGLRPHPAATADRLRLALPGRRAGPDRPARPRAPRTVRPTATGRTTLRQPPRARDAAHRPAPARRRHRARRSAP